MGRPPKTPKKKPAKAAKPKPADAVEVERRVKFVAEMMLDGYSSRELEAMIMESYGVQERQARKYVEKARKKFAETLDGNFQENLNLACARRLMIFRKCMDSRSYRDAHAVLQDHDRLTGLYRLAEAAAEPKEQAETQTFKIDDETQITF